MAVRLELSSFDSTQAGREAALLVHQAYQSLVAAASQQSISATAAYGQGEHDLSLDAAVYAGELARYAIELAKLSNRMHFAVDDAIEKYKGEQ